MCKIHFLTTHSTLQLEIQSFRKFQQSNFFVLQLMKNLTFDDHINKATTKISKSVGVI